MRACGEDKFPVGFINIHLDRDLLSGIDHNLEPNKQKVILNWYKDFAIQYFCSWYFPLILSRMYRAALSEIYIQQAVRFFSEEAFREIIIWGIFQIFLQNLSQPYFPTKRVKNERKSLQSRHHLMKNDTIFIKMWNLVIWFHILCPNSTYYVQNSSCLSSILKHACANVVSIFAGATNFVEALKTTLIWGKVEIWNTIISKQDSNLANIGKRGAKCKMIKE